MLPFSLDDLLAAKLAENRRAPDGKLHASSHLEGSLRHLQLEMAGAPQIEPDIASEVNLAVGTAIHALFESAFRGKPVMLEVKLDPWLPEGWSGTADWIVWDTDRRCFILGDLKTQKSGSLHYIVSGGAKTAHIWQLSAYFHALVDMGIPLLDGGLIYYLPKNQLSASEGSPVAPSLQEVTPLPREQVHARMAERKAAVDTYLATLFKDGVYLPGTMPTSAYLTDALAPVQERDLKLFVNAKLKRPVIDVKMVPNWSTAYCDFPDELCNCRHQTANKVGSWDRDETGQLVYTPNKGAPQPSGAVLQPTPAMVAQLVKAQKAKEESDGNA